MIPPAASIKALFGSWPAIPWLAMESKSALNEADQSRDICQRRTTLR
jgi:hypothetical protein